jgi:putative heme iron utilization protein
LDDHGRPICLISTMAMHTQNVQADARASLLVTQEDSDGEPLGASRVTLVGDVLAVPNTELAQVPKLYLERHANSKYWIDFEDFSFYRMDVIDVYYVGGFGVMGWVSASVIINLTNPRHFAILLAWTAPRHYSKQFSTLATNRFALMPSPLCAGPMAHAVPIA